MMSSKKEQFNLLLDDMSHCGRCLHLGKVKDKSLYNIYSDGVREIPSIWTDWFSRLDSEIMVIGQDWGPYKDMIKLNHEYLKDKTEANWKYLIGSEKSLTKKKLEKFIIESSLGKISNIDDIFITNAVMCGRKGEQYRGDNIDIKKSTLFCSEFLKRQINIVKPKVIVTLGYYPLLSLSKIYGFSIADTLIKTIEEYDIIKIDSMVIVPAFHPVAQVSNDLQLQRYRKIWEYLR